MNRIISLETFLADSDFFIAEAKAGKIFVYPTDTVYGIWAIYTDKNRDAIFAIKKRDAKQIFSIIAPNFDWILANYITNKTKQELEEYLNRYHGVTYIFDYTKPGVRIIKHPIQSFTEKLWLPFITTSCNIAGEPIVKNIKDIPVDIAKHVDYIIDGGILWGRPSVLIDFIWDKIIER